MLEEVGKISACVPEAAPVAHLSDRNVLREIQLGAYGVA